MTGNPKRVYWDANVFLSYLDQDPDRIAVIEDLVRDAEQSQIEIVTSTMSIVEVAFAASERASGVLDARAEQRIDRLWSDPIVALIEFDADIGRLARTLIRAAMLRNFAGHGPTLKPADAIHLATAQAIDATAFHTYDPKLLNQTGLIGFPITEPRR